MAKPLFLIGMCTQGGPDPLSGRRFRPAEHLALLGLFGLVLATGCSDSDDPGAPPNVLLISIDTLRADHLHCYGYERATSPRIDALASEGVLFERAVSSTSWTLPAHLSMLTGLPVSAHGVCDDRLWTRNNSAGAPISPPLKGRFVSEDLADAGYNTAGFFTWKYLEPQFGFGAGFDTWERLGHQFFTHPVVGPEFQRLRAAGDVEGLRALAAKHPALFDDTLPSSPEVIEHASEWLGEQSADDPFFLFVHLFDVHDPYTPPAPFDTMFDPDYTGPIDGRRITSDDSPVRGDMPPRDLENLIARYDGGIAYVDHQVGELLDRLSALGLDENTLVILTSDHGEEFFEHGHKTHRRQLHMESVHVPLVMRWPASLPQGERVSGYVGIIDLAPSMLAACGIEAPVPLGGVDLLPFARGLAENSKRTYTAELMLFDGSSAPERHLGVGTGLDWTITRRRGDSTLDELRIDLAADPLGRGNGAPLGTAMASEHSGLMQRIRESFGSLRAAQPERSGGLPQLTDHDRQQLAAMGYTSGGEFGEGDENRLCIDGCIWPD
jgi:arylsulfatase A-like enzyme